MDVRYARCGGQCLRQFLQNFTEVLATKKVATESIVLVSLY